MPAPALFSRAVDSDKAILEAIENGVLGITPLTPNNVQPASVDLTLGENIEILTPGDIDLFSTDTGVLLYSGNVG